MTPVQQFLNSFDQTVFVQSIDNKGKQIKGNASVVVYNRIRFMSSGELPEHELKILSEQVNGVNDES